VQVLALGSSPGSGGEARSAGAFGTLGPDGSGVALAIEEDGTFVVGWQEARGAVRAAWMTRSTPGAVPERLSAARFRGSRPSIEIVNGVATAAWAETWIGARGGVEGRIAVRTGSRAARGAAEIAYDGALPSLRSGVLVFRDARPASARPRAYLGRLEGAVLPRVEQAMPANAAGESFAVTCGSDLFLVAPRTHSRIERLVGLRRYSAELVGQGPESEIFESGAAFEHADAQCIDGHLLVVFAGRPTREQAQASVRAVPMRCTAERETGQ
jgi:hypothetical protein